MDFCLVNVKYRNIRMASKQDIANRHLEKVITLCNEMLELADLGDNCRFDDGCGIVYGRLRDSGYKLRKLASDELSKHGDHHFPRNPTENS